MPDFQLTEDNNDRIAGISELGEQYVAPRFYSTPYYVSVAVAVTPFEIVPAVSGKQFVVSSMLLATDKNFASATVAETLTIYEAHSADLSTIIDTFTQVDFLRNDRLVATNLNLITCDTVSLVAIATDAAVDVTIAGYYVDTMA